MKNALDENEKRPGEDLSKEKLLDILCYHLFLNDPKTFIHEFVEMYYPENVRVDLWKLLELAVQSDAFANMDAWWKVKIMELLDRLVQLVIAVELIHNPKP